MTFQELKNKAKNYPLFKLEDIFKWFPKAKREITLNQLNFWCKKDYLERIRQGVYKLADFELSDAFILANFVYSPSYISLETALNYYSIVPDIPFITTSVTVNKTKKFKIRNYGPFTYNHIKTDLFFGFQSVLVGRNYSYNIALPEKALLDYFYLRAQQIDSAEGFIKELRLSLSSNFSLLKLKNWSKLVRQDNKTFHTLLNFLLKKYGK